jgi:hypothetical protein
MTADFQLLTVWPNRSVPSGWVQTGYAFLLDSDGHIIAMPPQGYDFFGLQPEVLEMNEEPKQTIFDGTMSLRDAANLEQDDGRRQRHRDKRSTVWH